MKSAYGKQEQLLRYVVRPRTSTIAGWYVWSVVTHRTCIDYNSPELELSEQWAADPYALYPTKREAAFKANQLNLKIKSKAVK